MISLREREWRLRSVLIKRRKAAGMTQAEVAKRLGKPQSFVAKYEGGHRRLQLTEFLSVADAIGFDAAYVIRNLALAERRPIARAGPHSDVGVH